MCDRLIPTASRLIRGVWAGMDDMQEEVTWQERKLNGLHAPVFLDYANGTATTTSSHSRCYWVSSHRHHTVKCVFCFNSLPSAVVFKTEENCNAPASMVRTWSVQWKTCSVAFFRRFRACERCAFSRDHSSALALPNLPDQDYARQCRWLPGTPQLLEFMMADRRPLLIRSLAILHGRQP